MHRKDKKPSELSDGSLFMTRRELGVPENIQDKKNKKKRAEAMPFILDTPDQDLYMTRGQMGIFTPAEKDSELKQNSSSKTCNLF